MTASVVMQPPISTTIVIVVIILALMLFTTALVVVLLVWFQRKKKKSMLNLTAEPKKCDTSTELFDTNDASYSFIGIDNNLSREEGNYAMVENINQIKAQKYSSVSQAVNRSSKSEVVKSDDEHNLQDTGQLYAVVDKSAKKRIAVEEDKADATLDNSGVYSVIDRKAYENAESEVHDITGLYAIVDKSAKKKKKAETQDLSQLYAVVDKTKKIQNSNEQ